MKYKGNKDNNKEWLGLKGRGLKGGFSEIEVDDEEGEEEEEEEEKEFFQIPPAGDIFKSPRAPAGDIFKSPRTPAGDFFKSPRAPAGDFFKSPRPGIFSIE